jgi:hypothetical protein
MVCRIGELHMQNGLSSSTPALQFRAWQLVLGDRNANALVRHVAAEDEKDRPAPWSATRASGGGVLDARRGLAHAATGERRLLRPPQHRPNDPGVSSPSRSPPSGYICGPQTQATATHPFGGVIASN